MSSGFNFSRNSLDGEWESLSRADPEHGPQGTGEVGTETGTLPTHSIGGARVPSWCSRSVCRSLSTSP